MVQTKEIASPNWNSWFFFQDTNMPMDCILAEAKKTSWVVSFNKPGMSAASIILVQKAASITQSFEENKDALDEKSSP